jgi:plasmid maintenance system antidote protein VapI
MLGRRCSTTDTALRLGQYFGMTAAFWINLQTHHDLDVADRSLRKKLEREVEPSTA